MLRRLFALLLAASAAGAGAQTFGSAPGRDGSRLQLTCADGLDTACALRVLDAAGKPSAPTALRFGPATAFSHVVAEGQEAALASPADRDHPLDPDAIRVVRAVVPGSCRDAAQMTAVVWLCPAPGTDIVLFLRGLCDRCKAEPIVLRKQP